MATEKPETLSLAAMNALLSASEGFSFKVCTPIVAENLQKRGYVIGVKIGRDWMKHAGPCYVASFRLTAKGRETARVISFIRGIDSLVKGA